MSKNMDKSHVSSKPNRSSAVILIRAAFLFFGVLLSQGMAMAQKADAVETTVETFLNTWLVKRDVEGSLTYISNKPVFPSCWVEKGESLKWRKDRAQVIAKVRPVLNRLATDSAASQRLNEIIESQRVKLEYPRLPTRLEDLVDIYPVDDKMRSRLLNVACRDRGHDDSEFLKQGINSQKELYLVLFHFKEGLLVTMLWTMESGSLRLLYLEFPTG